MSVSGAQPVAEGITNPPIDDLLTKTDSKYKLVLYSAKRARQINAYYSQLGEGLLEYVGPLVEPGPREKPLSIAMREIQAGLLEHTEGDAERAQRLETAREELAAESEFDVTVVNRQIHDAGEELVELLRSGTSPGH